jgi:hypothetical protein
MMMINEGLDDDWVMNSVADTDVQSVGSSVPHAPADPLSWILNAHFRQYSCPHCQIGLSIQFIQDPLGAELVSTECTCTKKSNSPDRIKRQSRKQMGLSSKTNTSTQAVAPMKPIVPMGSLNKLNDSLLSPYLVFMEREYFGDHNSAGSSLSLIHCLC